MRNQNKTKKVEKRKKIEWRNFFSAVFSEKWNFFWVEFVPKGKNSGGIISR